MIVRVETIEHISYNTKELEGVESCLVWDNNREYLDLCLYKDSDILEYLQQRGINPDDVILKYVHLGYDYVA